MEVLVRDFYTGYTWHTSHENLLHLDMLTSLSLIVNSTLIEVSLKYCHRSSSDIMDIHKEDGGCGVLPTILIPQPAYKGSVMNSPWSRDHSTP